MLQNISAYAVGASFVSSYGTGVWIYIWLKKPNKGFASSFQKSTNHRRFAALHLSRPLKAEEALSSSAWVISTYKLDKLP